MNTKLFLLLRNIEQWKHLIGFSCTQVHANGKKKTTCFLFLFAGNTLRSGTCNVTAALKIMPLMRLYDHCLSLSICHIMYSCMPCTIYSSPCAAFTPCHNRAILIFLICEIFCTFGPHCAFHVSVFILAFSSCCYCNDLPLMYSTFVAMRFWTICNQIIHLIRLIHF